MKKLLAATLACVMVFALFAACNNDKTSSSSSDGDDTSISTDDGENTNDPADDDTE
ncbi:MAG: hypothetical protein FWG69_04670 [Oscillospiraceae bacterium]|nr:hypothetical protein [Oscillospiraceae bacterium]